MEEKKLTFDDFYADVDYVASHHHGGWGDEDKFKEELKWVFDKYYNSTNKE